MEVYERLNRDKLQRFAIRDAFWNSRKCQLDGLAGGLGTRVDLRGTSTRPTDFLHLGCWASSPFAFMTAIAAGEVKCLMNSFAPAAPSLWLRQRP
jgi:hypothetical protein